MSEWPSTRRRVFKPWCRFFTWSSREIQAFAINAKSANRWLDGGDSISKRAAIEHGNNAAQAMRIDAAECVPQWITTKILNLIRDANKKRIICDCVPLIWAIRLNCHTGRRDVSLICSFFTRDDCRMLRIWTFLYQNQSFNRKLIWFYCCHWLLAKFS